MTSTASPFPPASTVIAYLRDSGGENQDLSTAQQENEIRTWCAQNHHPLAKIFTDEATPGSSVIPRTNFLAMIEYLTNVVTTSVVTGIVIWQFSRFSRQIDDSQFYKSGLRRLGYIIHSLNENIPAGLDGALFEAVIDWKNARFLQELSIDVKRGLRHNIATHGAIGGIPPRGFIRGPDIHLGTRRNGQPHIVHRWIPNPDLAPLVRHAFHLRATGASYAEISSQTRLYTNKTSWSHFFANPIYRGDLHYGGQIIKNYCEPLVDDATWHTVQNHNQRSLEKWTLDMKDHPRAQTSSYLLTGLLKCSLCGSPMTGNTIQEKTKRWTRSYYTCQRKHTLRTEKCPARLIPQHTIENAVIREICDNLLTIDNLRQKRAELASSRPDTSDLHARLAQITRQITSTRLQISRLTDAIAAAGHSTALIEKLHQKETEAAQLKQHQNTLDDQIAAADHLPTDTDLQTTIDQLHAKLTAADRPTLRKILHGLINDIHAQRTENKISGQITYYLPGDCMPMGQSHRRVYTHTHTFIAAI